MKFCSLQSARWSWFTLFYIFLEGVLISFKNALFSFVTQIQICFHVGVQLVREAEPNEKTDEDKEDGVQPWKKISTWILFFRKSNMTLIISKRNDMRVDTMGNWGWAPRGVYGI